MKMGLKGLLVALIASIGQNVIIILQKISFQNFYFLFKLQLSHL